MAFDDNQMMTSTDMQTLISTEGFVKIGSWTGTNKLERKQDMVQKIDLDTSVLSGIALNQMVQRSLMIKDALPTDNPPSVVTGLYIGSIFNTYVNLCWNAATDDNGVVRYHVYKRHTGDTTWIYTGYATSGLCMTLTGLFCGTAYDFSVAAEDTIGQFSNGYSNVASGTTTACNTTPRKSFASRNVQGRTASVACGQTTNTTYWHDGAQPHPTYGDRIYKFETGSDTLGGEESLWWKIGLTIPAAMQVDENGYLYNISYC